MKSILFLLFVFNIQIQTYSYDSVKQIQKSKKTSLTEIAPKNGVISIYNNRIKIDNEIYYYPSTSEYRSVRKVDSCCEIAIDRIFKNKNESYFLYTKYINNRLVYLTIYNNQKSFEFLNIKMLSYEQ